MPYYMPGVALSENIFLKKLIPSIRKPTQLKKKQQ